MGLFRNKKGAIPEILGNPQASAVPPPAKISQEFPVAGGISTAGPSSPSSGGGVNSDFIINKNKINLNLRPGQSKREQLIISNNGNLNLKITLENLGLEDFMKIDLTEFDLGVGESKTVDLVFEVGENIPEEIYSGSIIIKGNGKTKEVLIVLDVSNASSLFGEKEFPFSEPKELGTLTLIIITVIILIILIIFLLKKSNKITKVKNKKGKVKSKIKSIHYSNNLF